MRSRSKTHGLRSSVAGALALTLLLAVGPPPSDSPVADAAMRGDAAMVRSLLEEGADVNAPQGDGMTALHWAGLNGNGELAAMLLYAGANPAATTRVGSYTPLHMAARAGSADVIDALMDVGVSVDRRTSTGVEAIHLAAGSGSEAALTALLDAGASVDAIEGVSGQTPLMFAVAYDRQEAVDLLLQRGADPSIMSAVVDFVARGKAASAERQAYRNRMEALRAAAEEAREAAEEVDEGEEPAAAQGTPGEEEAEKEAAAAKEEAEKQAGEEEPAAKEEAEKQAAATKAAAGEEEAKKAAAAEEEPVAEEDEAKKDGEEAKEEKEEPKGPQRLGFDEQVGKQGGMTALHYAARDGRMDAVVSLIAAGADVDRPTGGDHSTPLLVATINGQYDVAMYLLENGADPNLVSDDGAAPLFTTLNNRWAPKAFYPQPTAFKQQHTGYLELMEALLDAGADPDARLAHDLWYTEFNFGLLGVNMTGATAFWRAAYSQDVDGMKLLVAYGADPTIATQKLASGRRRFRRGGDDEEEKDKSGVPEVAPGGPSIYPIIAAAGAGYGQGFAANSHRGVPDGWVPAVRYLIEELGADPNARDAQAYTPLHFAAARGDNELILYLVSRGAEVTAVNREGQTTVDMANGPQQRVQPFPETIALLESLGGVNNHNCVTC